MKICLLHVMSQEDIPGTIHWQNQCLESALKAKRSDTEIEVKWAKPAVRRASDTVGLYSSLLDKVQIAEKILEAYREGFDAVVVLCFFDPCVAEGNEIVDIPVVGEGEASMHLACMLGYKFGIVIAPDVAEQKFIKKTENQIWIHALQDRAIPNPIECPVLPEGKTFDQLFEEDMKQPGVLASLLVDAAEKCVSRGAEVIVIGSTGMSAALTAAGISKLEGCDVPIIDCIAAAVKMAEVRVDLKNNMGLPSMSRAGLYSRLSVSDRDVRRLRRVFGLPELLQ